MGGSITRITFRCESGPPEIGLELDGLLAWCTGHSGLPHGMSKVVQPKASCNLLLIPERSRRGLGSMTSGSGPVSIASSIALLGPAGGLLGNSPVYTLFIILSSSWSGHISTKQSDQCCAECWISSSLLPLLMLR